MFHHLEPDPMLESEDQVCFVEIKRYAMRVCVLLSVLPICLTATITGAALNEQIVLNLETPAAGATLSGVAFVRGWAVAPAGIERVELYFDGAYLLDIPIGETRPDVARLFPTFPDAGRSGFNIALQYSKLPNGVHTATVRAVDNNADHREVSASFNVTRFDTSLPNNFIREPAAVSLDQSRVDLQGETIAIADMRVDNAFYDVNLQWNTTLQGFGITTITPDAAPLGEAGPAPRLRQVQRPGTDGLGRAYREHKQEGRKTDSAKIDYRLRALAASLRKMDRAAQGTQADFAALSSKQAQIDAQGNIQVYIHFRPGDDDIAAILAQHRVIVELTNTDLGVIQAWVPFTMLDTVAELPFVKRVTLPVYGISNAGSVQTEGDSILNADALRTLGTDGTGVKVGAISDGANNQLQAVASGDLPDGITLFGDCTAVTAGDCDEGTAIMEIIHDIAPGAQLGFCPVTTNLEFIDCVQTLATVYGADIVVDDLFFPGEPYFEDGPVAQAVAGAVDSGVVYVTSAGNSGASHYEAQFQGSLLPDLQVPVHDFGLAAGASSDQTMDIVIPSGADAVIALQWNDPFGASGNDYDLLLVDETETTLLAVSANPQDGDDNPQEFLFFRNRSLFDIRAKIAIVQFLGEDRLLEMFIICDPCVTTIEGYNVADGSIVGHAALPGVLAVGAIAAGDPGNDDIRSYSSRGPATILIPAPETRPKPDVAAIDGVAVTGAGGFPSHFAGTSAAAPHVAGIAALLQGLEATATASQITAAIRQSAIDLGPAGFDNAFGHGRIDALAASAALQQIPIEMNLETPAPGAVYSGVSFIRGWAVAPAGIERIELYVDGAYLLDIPLGESRPDVGGLFPTFPGSDKSGFNMAFQYSKLPQGPHKAVVQALAANGQREARTAAFTITRFNTTFSNNFIRDPGRVTLGSATVTRQGENIFIDNLLVDSLFYDVVLRWNVELQSFGIFSISSDAAD